MPDFSRRSISILSTCDNRLITIFNRVVVDFDCSIISGHREKGEQDELVRRGLSTLKYPKSKHNTNPSLAVDVYPYPINWNDRERMTFFAGYVLGIAESLNTPLRWGGDWDGDWQVRDNVFDDLGHFELRFP